MALPTKLTLNIVTPDHSLAHEVDEVSLPGSRAISACCPATRRFSPRSGPA